jgi:hypothetical protein
MTEKLCEKDEAFWGQAETTTKQALQKRIDLWNAAYTEIVKQKVEA